MQIPRFAAALAVAVGLLAAVGSAQQPCEPLPRIIEQAFPCPTPVPFVLPKVVIPPPVVVEERPAVVPPVVVVPKPGIVTPCPEVNLKVVKANALLVAECYREVILYAGTEVAILKKSVSLAREKAEKLGYATLEMELAAQLKLLNTRDTGHVPRCCDKEELCHAKVYRTASAKLKAELADIRPGDARADQLKELIRLLDRAYIHSAKVLQLKGEACELSLIHCRVVSTRCWNECDIRSAKRMGYAARTLHSSTLNDFLPLVALQRATWSKEKAELLGGKHDLDTEACAVWCVEVKPLLEKSFGETRANTILASAEYRTVLWLQVRRSLAYDAEAHVGREALLKADYSKTCATLTVEIAANTKVLEARLVKLLPECSPTTLAAVGNLKVETKEPPKELPKSLPK